MSAPSSEAVAAMEEEMAKIAVAVGRSKDGTGLDWFELSDDVKGLAQSHDELETALRQVRDLVGKGLYGSALCTIDVELARVGRS